MSVILHKVLCCASLRDSSSLNSREMRESVGRSAVRIRRSSTSIPPREMRGRGSDGSRISLPSDSRSPPIRVCTISLTWSNRVILELEIILNRVWLGPAVTPERYHTYRVKCDNAWSAWRSVMERGKLPPDHPHHVPPSLVPRASTSASPVDGRFTGTTT